jgi:glycosyltransferase involved in cell wall biosynthesis
MNPYLIIIPSYNEEQALGGVLEELLRAQLPVDILVVNDGSSDRTVEVAARYPVTVLSHPYNLGYGAALQTGYLYAVSRKYPYVFQFDADGQHSPQDLPAMIRVLEEGEADIVMGSRFLPGSAEYHVDPLKRLAIRYFRWLIKRLTGVYVSDPTSGLRGISRRVFEYYAGRDRFPADFPDADILIQMILRKYRIREVPAHMRYRTAGVSMHVGIKPFLYLIKMTLSILLVLIRNRLSKRSGKP